MREGRRSTTFMQSIAGTRRGRARLRASTWARRGRRGGRHLPCTREEAVGCSPHKNVFVKLFSIVIPCRSRSSSRSNRDPHQSCPNPRRPAAFPHLGRFQVILARLHTGLEGWTTHSLSIGAPGRRNASRLERDRRALGRTRARTACAGPKPGSRQSRSAGEAAHRAHEPEPCLPPTRLSWPAVRSAELLCGPDIASGCALGHQGIGIVATSGQAWSPATA